MLEAPVPLVAGGPLVVVLVALGPPGQGMTEPAGRASSTNSTSLLSFASYEIAIANLS